MVDHLYIPEADVIAYWERRSVRILDRVIRNEWRYQVGRDALHVFLIMLVGFAAYRIVGGFG